MKTARIAPTTEDYVDLWDEVHRSGDLAGASRSESLARKLFGHNGKAHRDEVYSVLDLGCGEGGFLRYLGSRKFSAFGVDICPTLFSLNLRDLAASPCDIADLSQFSDDSYDMVTGINLLEYLETKDLSLWAVTEMVRISRIGAVISFGEEVAWSGGKLNRVKRGTAWWRGLIEHHFPSCEYSIGSGARKTYQPTVCYAKHERRT